MKTVFHTGMLLMWCMAAGSAYGQTYAPVAISGFNNDGIAEAGTDASAVTSTSLDLSSYIMYSAGFAAANALPGGLPDNGTITSGIRTYQLQPYTGNNILYLSTGGLAANTAGSGTFTLTAPARYSRISLLLFSTEGHSTISVVLNFTDGTTVNAGSFLVQDWFGGTGAVFAAFGRTTRLTAPPYTPDGIGTGDPRMYPLDITLGCVNQSKLLQSITLTHLSGTTSGSRLVALAVSGTGYTPVAVTPAITAATCSNANGSIGLTVTGGTGPFTYLWNTTPAQTTATASGLAAGNYTCTITGADNCAVTYQETVPLLPLAVLTATASPAQVCSGEPVMLSVSTGGGVTNYTWNPGAQSGTNVTVSPAATTTYTVNGQDGNGCDVSASVTVDVNPLPAADFIVSPAEVCQGTAQTVSFTGTAGSAATYNWNGFAGATVNSGSGAGPYDIVFNTPGTYNLQLQVTENGCASTIATQQVIISTPATAGFDLSRNAVCTGDTVLVTFTGSASGSASPSWNWGGGTILNGSGFGPYIVRYNSTGIISLTITDGACVAASPSSLVTVVPVPVAAFTPDKTTGCPPALVQFTNQSQNADEYKWTFGDGGTSPAIHPDHIYTETGTYTVTLIATAQELCADTLSKTSLVQIKPAPVAAFTSLPPENTPVELHLANFLFSNESDNATAYHWHFGDSSFSSLTGPAHKYDYPGNYVVTLTAMNDIGCTDTFSRRYYQVVPDEVLVIPNAFSPNGDGVNDIWDIPGLKGFPDCSVEIFNRWGQAIIKSIGYTRPWDGNYNTRPVPVGTYYYVIKTSVRNYYGWVVVLR